jgi:N-acetyl-1-D-myo-inositol-2-amino-2-deoxy-alpha-D-glucopyranoside deacetylase
MTAAGGLLGVFAHPDDEAYSMAGCMARYTDEGIHVANLCFTRGEVGLIAEGSGATRETLGEVREAELRAACAAVGVTDVRIVGTADSGTEANEKGVEAIAGVIRELRPRVIVTMEPQGVTRHPDHIAVSQMASDAFHRVRAESDGAFPERLYYSAIPESALIAFTAELEKRGLPGLGRPDDPLAPQPAADDTIAAVVDVTEHLERKIAALRAHLTQTFEMVAWMPEEVLPLLLGTEGFQRPFPAFVAGELPEGDLFAAYRTADGAIT